MKRGPKPRPAHERVLARTERRGDCLIFTGSITSVGYGQVQVGSNDDGTRRPDKAHRVIWEAARGPIPAGDVVHHRCGVRACVALEHLELVDAREHGREHGLVGAAVRWRGVREGNRDG